MSSDLRARTLVAPALGLFVSSIALADTIDPSMPRTLAIGAPRGAAPSERLDAARTGGAKTRLPRAPVELWRRHVTGGLEFLPVVDADDGIFVALTLPEVVKLAPDGKEVFRVRLGAAAPVAPPVLTSDGTLAVITAAGQAWGISPTGAVRYTTALGVRGRDVDTAPLALPDGGLLVAAGGTLIALDRDGTIRARASLEPRAGAPDSRITGALLLGPEEAGALFTTETGAVYGFRPPGGPRKLGSFGGFPRKGAMLADARTLLAIVDSRRLVALDLPTGTTHTRASTLPGALFDGPVTVALAGAPNEAPKASPPRAPGGRERLALVALQSGLLLGFDAAGNEKLRVSLEKQASPQDGAPSPAASGIPAAGAPAGFFGPQEQKPSPPLIADPDGRIGFARAAGRVGVVTPEGQVALAGERVCAVPVGVVPAGDKRMLLACRDGGLWLYGE